MFWKSILMPLTCFGIPLTAGFIVLAASGVVDLQIFQTSSNSQQSKKLLIYQTSKRETQKFADDHEIADDAFMRTIDNGTQPIESEAQPQQSQQVNSRVVQQATDPRLKKGKIEISKPSRSATKGDIRKIQEKIQSPYTKNYFSLIRAMFLTNGLEWTGFATDIVKLVNNYWSSDSEKISQISNLLNLYKGELAKLSERDKKALLNYLNNIIL